MNPTSTVDAVDVGLKLRIPRWKIVCDLNAGYHD